MPEPLRILRRSHFEMVSYKTTVKKRRTELFKKKNIETTENPTEANFEGAN